jgi:hypothetical protein
MPKYENLGVDQTAFQSFITSPTSEQLAIFIELLRSDEGSNSWFEEEPPRWKTDAESWVRKHLNSNDWYGELSEPEMVAWDGAVFDCIEQLGFETSSNLDTMTHGAVDFDVLEFAAEVHRANGHESICGRMFPYRFHGLPPEIEALEPWDRIFHANHALLDVLQVEKLILELSDYDNLLKDFAPSSESVFSSIEDRKINAVEESQELLEFLASLVRTNSMWLAMVDS